MDCSAECLHQLRVDRAAAELFSQLLSSVSAGFFLHQLQIHFHVPGKTFFQSVALRHGRCADAGTWIVFLLSCLSVGRRFGDGRFPGYRSPCSLCVPRGPHGLDPELSGFLCDCDIDSRLPDPLAYAARGFDSRSPHIGGKPVGKEVLGTRSSPSNAKLASAGEIMPPCGVPSVVSWRTCLSMYPDFSHFRRMARSIGTWAKSQS